MGFHHSRCTSSKVTAAADLNYIPAGKDHVDEYDCVPRALSRLTGLSISEVSARLGRLFGKGYGVPCRFTLDDLPFDFKDFRGKGYQVRDLPTLLPHGFYMAEVERHVFAHVDGKSYDIIPADLEEDWYTSELLGAWEMKDLNATPEWVDKLGCCQDRKKVF